MSPTSFARCRRHALGGGPGGQAARLQHDQLAAVDPGLVEERERYARRLASAGRGDKNGVRADAQARSELSQYSIDRQRGVEGAHARWIPDAIAGDKATRYAEASPYRSSSAIRSIGSR